MATKPTRVVSTSMVGMTMLDVDRWSGAVTVVLGQNPGPFTGPGTNTFLVGSGRRRLLIDTGQGVASYLDLLERALSDGDGGCELQEILLTHAHPDHIGGVESILERFGALRVSKKPRPRFDRGIQINAIDETSRIATEGATLTALWTPGHATDHLCFYMHEEKAVFSGDLVLGAGTTVIPLDGDLGDYLASLERLLATDMEVIYPAHGPAIHDPHAKVRQYLAHRALRDQQILEGLAAGLSEVDDLVRRIYVDVPEFLYPAAAISVQAHLRKFEKESVVAHDGPHWVLVGEG